MDVSLRALEREYQANPTEENEARLAGARRRAGWVLRYVACNHCNSETRCTGKGRNVALCPVCGGQGWTETILVPPQPEAERYKNPPPPSYHRR